MKNNQYIVIVGCGRLGSYLANLFSHKGNSVVVIDNDQTAFSELSSDFSGFRVEGDATQMAVLIDAKLEKADIVITATREDNTNLMVAQVARKIFRVSHVLARVFDPKSEEVFSQLGVETICPTSIAASMFIQASDNSKITEQKEYNHESAHCR